MTACFLVTGGEYCMYKLCTLLCLLLMIYDETNYFYTFLIRNKGYVNTVVL